MKNIAKSVSYACYLLVFIGGFLSFSIEGPFKYPSKGNVDYEMQILFYHAFPIFCTLFFVAVIAKQRNILRKHLVRDNPILKFLRKEEVSIWLLMPLLYLSFFSGRFLGGLVTVHFVDFYSLIALAVGIWAYRFSRRAQSELMAQSNK